MYLRALGSLLTRRFSPRVRRRDLAVGDGPLGVAVAGALAGLVGYLYLKKDPAGEVAGDEARTEVPDPDKKPFNEADMAELAIMARFVDKDGHFAWLEYHDYLINQRYHGGRPNKKVPYKDPNEDWEAAKREPVKDEAAMKARFEDWMKQHGRTYKNEEEKARRYEEFKVAV